MAQDSNDHSVRIARLVPASVEDAFAAWTRPELVARWFAPGEATVGAADLDVRVGGAWRVRMDGPEGTTYVCEGRYREIDPPRRLVFTWDWAEGEHRMDRDTVVTVTFEEADGGTRVVVLHEGLPSPEQAEGHTVGWTMALDQLVDVSADD